MGHLLIFSTDYSSPDLKEIKYEKDELLLS